MARRGRGNTDASVSTGGVQCYLTEGFSQRFFDNLQKFASWLFSKYGEELPDEEEYVDALTERVFLLLQTGVYDPEQANLQTFIHSAGRNMASAMKSKRSKIYQDEFDFNAVASEEYQEEIDPYTEEFVELVGERGLSVNAVDLIHDVKYGLEAPLVEVYVWMQFKRKRCADVDRLGAVSGIGRNIGDFRGGVNQVYVPHIGVLQ